MNWAVIFGWIIRNERWVANFCQLSVSATFDGSDHQKFQVAIIWQRTESFTSSIGRFKFDGFVLAIWIWCSAEIFHFWNKFWQNLMMKFVDLKKNNLKIAQKFNLAVFAFWSIFSSKSGAIFFASNFKTPEPFFSRQSWNSKTISSSESGAIFSPKRNSKVH